MSVIPSIWVCFILALVASLPQASHPMPKLRVIDRNQDYIKQQAAGQAPRPTRKAQAIDLSNYGNDFIKEYLGKTSAEFPTPTHEREGQFEDLNFETQEIQETVDFIEFKMSEVNALMKECMARHFAFDPMAKIEDVKLDCVGNSYQILIMSYKEGMRRVKDVLVELIRVKLPQITDDFTEEIAFFVDLIDQLVDSDFKIEETLPIAKKACKYYVSPRLFDRIIEYAQAELVAFATVQTRLRNARNEVQKTLEDYESGQMEEVRRLSQVSTPATQRWRKEEIFGKLDTPSRYVGNYLHQPTNPTAHRMQSKVDSFLKTKQGDKLLKELSGRF